MQCNEVNHNIKKCGKSIISKCIASRALLAPAAPSKGPANIEMFCGAGLAFINL